MAVKAVITIEFPEGRTQEDIMRLADPDCDYRTLAEFLSSEVQSDLEDLTYPVLLNVTTEVRDDD